MIILHKKTEKTQRLVFKYLFTFPINIMMMIYE